MSTKLLHQFGSIYVASIKLLWSDDMRKDKWSVTRLSSVHIHIYVTIYSNCEKTFDCNSLHWICCSRERRWVGPTKDTTVRESCSKVLFNNTKIFTREVNLINIPSFWANVESDIDHFQHQWTTLSQRDWALSKMLLQQVSKMFYETTSKIWHYCWIIYFWKVLHLNKENYMSD